MKDTMLESVREQLHAHKVDGLLITNRSNVFALSGFKGSNALALIMRSHAYVFTDPRYLEKAEDGVSSEWKVQDMSLGLFDVLQTLVAKHRLQQVGFEANHTTVAFHHKLNTLMGVQWKSTVDLVERVRQIKNLEQRKSLRLSQRLNEETLKLTLERIKPGMTEIAIAWIIRLMAHDLGAEDLSFSPIVAFGAHTSRPHHEPTSKKLKRGDMVLIDMGVTHRSMASDLTRTFFTKVPTAEQGDVYQTVLTAHQAAVLAAQPGNKADDVDRAARLFISDSGYKKKFGHATGHGIGYDVHELPRVAKGDMTELTAGMVIAIEPGIYVSGKFGVRIEDLVEITAQGNKSLNHVPKDLLSARLKI